MPGAPLFDLPRALLGARLPRQRTSHAVRELGGPSRPRRIVLGLPQTQLPKQPRIQIPRRTRYLLPRPNVLSKLCSRKYLCFPLPWSSPINHAVFFSCRCGVSTAQMNGWQMSSNLLPTRLEFIAYWDHYKIRMTLRNPGLVRSAQE